MNEQIIFKSKEGKQEILNFYNSVMSALDYKYNEVYVETSFGTTYLFEAGNKQNPPIFLFHGSCTNSAMWYADIKHLSKDFHVYSVDILGEPGKSDENRLDLKSDEHAKWINEILEKLNIDKATFMGNSLGAWMSLKFAVTYPEKADKLVLIAPSGIVPAKISFVLKSIFYAMQGEKGLSKIGKLITGTDTIPDEVLYFNKLIANHFNPIIGGLPVFADEALTKLTMPILLMCGEHDVITDATKSASRLKKTTKQPVINIVKDNGHIIYNAMDTIIPYLKGAT